MSRTTALKTELYLFVALLLIFIIAARTPIDSDLWWHLRAGESTLRTAQPVTEDPFSYTRVSETWINHSWLSQVILFLSFDFGSYFILSLVIALLAVVSMYLVYMQLEGGALSGTFLLTAGSIVASVVWVARPQMFSFFLLALLSFFCFKYGENYRRLFLFLVPLFILWSNLHGGYILGIIYLGCLLLSKLITKLFVEETDSDSWRRIGIFVLGILACYLAVVVNPNGISMWFIPFNTVGVSGLQNLISEWASPDFHEPVQQLFLLYFFVSVFLLGKSEKRVKLNALILFCCFGMMAFIARRNIGPFIIISLPVIAGPFKEVILSIIQENSFLRKLFEKAKDESERSSKVQFSRYLNGAILFILGFAGVLKLMLVTQPELVNQYISEMYPENAVMWIEAHHPEGQMLNEYDWGGYLIWALKDRPVFIDGRTDLFGDEMLNEWLVLVQCDDDWEALVDKWSIQYLLLKPGRPVVQCALQAGWEEVYSDELSVVMLRAYEGGP